MKALAGVAVLMGLAGPLAAQDSAGVRLGITYGAGVRPGLIILPGAGLDSVRAILQRDLDFSDRFEVVSLPSGEVARGGGSAINYRLYRTLGASYGVEVANTGTGIVVRLHDLDAGSVRREQRATLPAADAPEFRMAVHQLSDEVVRWITGLPGIAASRLVFLSDKQVYRVDSDGYDLLPVTRGEEALSPVWSPDGGRIAFTRFSDGHGPLV
ncbi:MAG: hypothetical protein ABI836_03900, partial [Gemmatimonadota bacterium]